jgi:hypothetical protein
MCSRSITSVIRVRSSSIVPGASASSSCGAIGMSSSIGERGERGAGVPTQCIHAKAASRTLARAARRIATRA